MLDDAASYGPIRPKPSGSLSSQLSARSSSLTPASCCRPGGRITSNSRVREAEFGAKLVRSYQPTMVLGVLQTPAYISAVFSPRWRLVAPGDVEASVASRLTRSKLLAESGCEWRLIQTEAGAALGRPQLCAHGRTARPHHRGPPSCPNVRLGIIALDTVSPQVAPLHSFHIYDGELGTFGTESGTALPSAPPACCQLRRAGATGSVRRRCPLPARSDQPGISQPYRLSSVLHCNKATVQLCCCVAKP